jgi:acyl-coenzyme A thioesterase PaaI-like protein
MAVEARRLESVDGIFGIEAASRVLTETLPPWMQELGLLVEAVEAGRPAAAPPDWQPGAIIRLPFSVRLARGGIVCSQALMAAADTAMAVACAAVWNAQRPASPVDQTIHFLRPANVDILADARIVRIGRNTVFGRVSLSSAVDGREIGMVSTAYAIL